MDPTGSTRNEALGASDQSDRLGQTGAASQTLRHLSDEDAGNLRPGDPNYRAYVGPPQQYDLMGGMQFSLLLALGLREHHRVLDFGCGSLRAGRLLIPYLSKGNYHGVEPNRWLVDDGLDRQLGRSILDVKAPRFYDFEDFSAERCGVEFDVILAQSVFSHTGLDLMTSSLAGFRRCLRHGGRIVMTIAQAVPPKRNERPLDGWVYPECAFYEHETIERVLADTGLYGRAVPWFHPRQTWYVVARDPARVPGPEHDRFLLGGVLDVKDWTASLT